MKFSGTLDFLNVETRVKVISMDLSLSHIKEYAIANFTMLIDL